MCLLCWKDSWGAEMDGRTNGRGWREVTQPREEGGIAGQWKVGGKAEEGRGNIALHRASAAFSVVSRVFLRNASNR